MSTRRQRIATVILIPLGAVVIYFGTFFTLWKGLDQQAGFAFANAAEVGLITIVGGGFVGAILFWFTLEALHYINEADK